MSAVYFSNHCRSAQSNCQHRNQTETVLCLREYNFNTESDTWRLYLGNNRPPRRYLNTRSSMGSRDDNNSRSTRHLLLQRLPSNQPSHSALILTSNSLQTS